MGMRNAIYFEYEKISDSIMWFGNKTCLKFNVNLGKKDRNGNKIPFFGISPPAITSNTLPFLQDKGHCLLP